MIRHHSYEGKAGTDGRVDAVSSQLFQIPRSVFSRSMATVLINGQPAKKSSRVKSGDLISVAYDEEIMEGLQAEDINLKIIYEDSSILVIDKAQSMLVHPGAGNYTGTVANALLGLYGDDFSVGDDSIRPGIVHRLDKDTSGVMVIAKTPQAHASLSGQFAEHSNEKYYEAIVKGTFRELSGSIDSNIRRDPNNRKKYAVALNKNDGKEAHTRYSVIAQNEGYAYLRIRILTGRTHQIRVHMASIGHPILGDPVYSKKDSRFPDATLMLNSAKLVLTHPETGVRMTFKSNTPERFQRILEDIGIRDMKQEMREDQH